MKCTADPAFIQKDHDYPIDERQFTGLREGLSALFDECSKAFRRPLIDNARTYPFEQMLSDAFDTVSQYGTGCLILEKNLESVGALGEQYQDYRHNFFPQSCNTSASTWNGEKSVRSNLLS